MTASGNLPTESSTPDLRRSSPAIRAALRAPVGRSYVKTKKKRLAPLVFVALLCTAMGGGALFLLRPAVVTVTPVVRGVAVDAVYATGSVEAFDRVVVKAKAAGTIELKVREGDVVKKGDLLALIASPSLKFDLARGRAEASAANQQAGAEAPQLAALEGQSHAIEAELKPAREERERLTRLVETGAVPVPELDRASARVQALEAQLASSAAQGRSLRIELDARASGSRAAADSMAARLADTEVRAPIAGVVLSRAVDEGEAVAINQPLLKMGDTSRLVLECQVDESDIGRVLVGAKAAVSIYAFRDRIFHGEVFEIMPDADRSKKAFLTKIQLLDAPAGLRSGMTVEANVLVKERPGALLAPAEAVDARGSVLVARAGHLERSTPTLGIRDMLEVEVVSGLAEGDLIVTGGAAGLKDGASIRTLVVPTREAARKSGVRTGTNP